MWPSVQHTWAQRGSPQRRASSTGAFPTQTRQAAQRVGRHESTHFMPGGTNEIRSFMANTERAGIGGHPDGWASVDLLHVGDSILGGSSVEPMFTGGLGLPAGAPSSGHTLSSNRRGRVAHVRAEHRRLCGLHLGDQAIVAYVWTNSWGIRLPDVRKRFVREHFMRWLAARWSHRLPSSILFARFDTHQSRTRGISAIEAECRGRGETLCAMRESPR
jgi:hypothetical protein